MGGNAPFLPPTKRSAIIAAISVLVSLCVAFASPCFGHGRSSPVDPKADGVSIPNLTHGQMRVIANNLGAILDVADQEFAPDPTTQKLQSFISLQYFFCFRSWMPGSVTDEDSPFNECSHAYLAGAQALLLHLKSLPGRRRAVEALASRIELEMLSNNTSLVLCRYSDEPFNSSEVLMPHWADFPSHPPTMMAIGGFAMTLLAGCWALARSGRSQSEEQLLPT